MFLVKYRSYGSCVKHSLCLITKWINNYRFYVVPTCVNLSDIVVSKSLPLILGITFLVDYLASNRINSIFYVCSANSLCCFARIQCLEWLRKEFDSIWIIIQAFSLILYTIFCCQLMYMLLFGAITEMRNWLVMSFAVLTLKCNCNESATPT